MLAKIKDILIIVNKGELYQYKKFYLMVTILVSKLNLLNEINHEDYQMHLFWKSLLVPKMLH